MAVAGGVLDAAVGDEVADVARFATAVFADERAVRVALERLMIRSVRIHRATVGYEIAEI